MHLFDPEPPLDEARDAKQVGAAAGGVPLMNLDGRSLRILVDENDAVNRLTLVEILQQAGGRCPVVGSGRDALAAGMDTYLAKPITEEQWIAAIREFFPDFAG